MGNTAEVTLIGGTSEIQELAERRLQTLEQLWSRFIPTSDISRLNTSRGEPTHVHRDTVTLVRYLVAAHEHTNGNFDPSLLPALVTLGYGTSMTNASMSTTLSAHSPISEPISSTRIDVAECVVQLPAGITLDPGGLGKGLAADMVANELIESGADGACVNVGGDLRCVGRGPNNDAWDIDIESPFDATIIVAKLTVRNGGVATSSTRAKRWHTRRGENHHVISPTTHLPLVEDAESPVQVTVIGSEAVWAEIFATATLVAGATEGLNLAQQSQLGTLVMLNNGKMVANAHWKEFLR